MTGLTVVHDDNHRTVTVTYGGETAVFGLTSYGGNLAFTVKVGDSRTVPVFTDDTKGLLDEMLSLMESTA